MQNFNLELDLTNNGCGAYDSSSDSDICDSSEICRIFNKATNICEKVIVKNSYILSVDATSENEPNVAVALSENCCDVLKLSNHQIAKVANFSECKDSVIGCKFSEEDYNLVYVGSSSGKITLWDIRTPKKPVIHFLDTTAENGKIKTFSCFDISSNGRLLTAGTDLFEGDAFLLFWDIRNHDLLGGYWESHTDDITQVKFHPRDKDKLISGSTDGLINVYDLSQSSEEDALVDSLNTQSSVDQLLWYNENGKTNVSCITHTSDLQLWNLNDAEPYKHFTRDDVAKKVKKKHEEFTYIANVHNTTNSILVLAGSNDRDGECLRSLQLKDGDLQPAFGFYNNKQRVRCSWYNPNLNILLTGGEKGILDAWNLQWDELMY